MLCIKCGADVPLSDFNFCPICGFAQNKLGKAKKTRGNSQGSVFKRGKAWTAQVVVDWRLPSDPSKHKIPIKRTLGGFALKKDAVEALGTIRAAYEAEQEKKSRPKSAPSLLYYWQTYKTGAYTKLSDSKQTAYRIAWEKRVSVLQDMAVDALTVRVLQDTLNEKCESFYQMKDCKNLLSNLFKLAAADGFVSKEVPALITLPELEEKETTPFSDEEQIALWRAYEKGEKSVCLPLLMIYTGMRPGETQKLRVDQINLEKQEIVGAGSKTKAGRAIPIVIAESIVPVVQDLIDSARADGYLWVQSKDDWYTAYYHALEVAGVEKRNPYSCRHTTATALAVDQNIAPQTIKRVMRWSTARMLDRYAHPDTTDALNAVNTIKKKVEDTTDKIPTTK